MGIFFQKIIALPYLYAQEVQLLEPGVLGGEGSEAPAFKEYITNIFTQLLIVAAVLAVLMIVIGGLQYIVSFSAGSKEEGKKRMMYAVGGLILALASWLILNTINNSLTTIDFTPEAISSPPPYVPQYGTNGDPANWGKCREYGYQSCRWATISCNAVNGERNAPNQACTYPGTESTGGLICCGVEIPPGEQDNYLVVVQNAGTENARRCYLASYPNNEECRAADAAQGGGGQCVEASVFRDMHDERGGSIRLCSVVTQGGAWEYQTGIERQLGDASPEVLTMMTCLQEKLGVEISKYKISSISDSNHIGRLNECRIPNASNCAHSRTSDHYGNGDNKSHALDIVPDNYNITLGNQLETYARECGATNTIWQSEGHYNHVHISTQ